MEVRLPDGAGTLRERSLTQREETQLDPLGSQRLELKELLMIRRSRT